MKTKILLIAFLCFSSILSVANKHPRHLSNKMTDSLLTILIDKIENQDDLENIYVIQPETKQEAETSDPMPWISALIICILTLIINLLINYSHKKQAKLQLKSNENSLEKTLKSSQEIALEGMNHEKEIAHESFKATFKLKNQQNWVNEVRDTLMKLMTNGQLALHFNKHKNDERCFNCAEQVFLNQNKLLLLLNPLIDYQKELLDVVQNYLEEINLEENEFNKTKFDNARTKLLFASQKFMKDQWEKIKDLKY